MNYILLNKPLGLSTQQAINTYRQKFLEGQKTKLGTIGRLDPMAEGLLVVMVGDENKNQPHYRGLDKTYEFELVLGVTTDSYDLLGLPTSPLTQVREVDESRLYHLLAKMKGIINQAYPPYSAVRVQGKPLYWWVRQNRINEIQIPTAERAIYELGLEDMQRMISSTFKKDIAKRIQLVEGDFRQDAILASWNRLFHSTTATTVWKVKLRMKCSSGTFVRGVVHHIGQQLGTGAVTYNIIRTNVGPWSLNDAVRLVQ